MVERPKDIYHPVENETVERVFNLMHSATYAALASQNSDTGLPMCTRVGLGLFERATPIIFVSELAAHTGALLSHPACSLLIGDVEKGDPLASARVTLNCQAHRKSRSDTDWTEMMTTYVASHPKAKLYAELTDFHFFALNIDSAVFVQGFGRAFKLVKEDFSRS